MLYGIVVSGNITHPDAAVSPFVKTVEVVRRAEVPAQRAGDHHPGVAVVSSVPVRELQADGPVQVYHVHPDLILLPGAVVAVRLKRPFFAFYIFQSPVQAVSFPVSQVS